ncbi:MAG: YdcF family protein [Proteobacteria bacterium]|nr:YdcF family protein [Pseudomonadota bacterium]
MAFLIRKSQPFEKLKLILIFLKKLFSLLLWSSTSFILIWALGFLFFLGYLSFFKEPLPPYEKTDLLVVLTGGKGRIIKGLSLINEDAATHLFISGVEKNVTGPDILLEATKKSASSLNIPVDLSKMQLGHHAKNTHENAQEVALWIKHQNMLNHLKNQAPLKSIRLVTSIYHMPRSLLEFKRALPNITFVPHPVFSSLFHGIYWWKTLPALKLSFSEYIKYNLAIFRICYEEIRFFLKELIFKETWSK